MNTSSIRSVSGCLESTKNQFYRTKDVGKHGKAKLITGLKKRAITKQAIRVGYIPEDDSISHIPKSKTDDFALDVVKKVGQTQAMRMFNTQIVLYKNMPDGFNDRMLIVKNAFRRKSKVLKVHRQK